MFTYAAHAHALNDRESTGLDVDQKPPPAQVTFSILKAIHVPDEV